MSSSPRVLFLTHTGALGGAELYLLDLAKAFGETSKVVLFNEGPLRKRLAAADVAVEVIAGSSDLLDIERGSHLLSGLLAVPAVFSLTKRVAFEARDFDLLFANSQKALMVGAGASFLSRRPLVWNLHDLLTADHFSRTNRRIATTCANIFATHVIANSKATRDALGSVGGNLEQSSVIYNGIDAAAFDRVSASEVAALRSALDLADTPVVGAFSRLAPWKGQHVLIRALKDLPDVHALLVGEALFQNDKRYKERLEVLVDELDLRERVHFLGFRSDIPELMQLVDIVIHTSTAPEPFGRVIVEGMLAGKPVIATRAGGATEIIEEPDTGCLIPPDDPEILAQEINDIMSDADRAREMGRSARSYARERFSKAKMVGDVRRVIDRILEQP